MTTFPDRSSQAEPTGAEGNEPMCAPGCGHPHAQLATGALSATLHGDHLLGLRINGVTAVERIYPTVRGIQWQTSTVEHHKVHVDILDDGFVAHVVSVHRVDRARIRCTLELRGSDSTIDVKATFTAVTDFSSRRLGLCLILPPDLEGNPIHAVTDNGLSIRSVLSRSIEPWPIVTGAKNINVWIDGRSTLQVDAAEDGLEMEDHRNWGDPGWKAYTPPLGDNALRTTPAATSITRRLTISAVGTTSQPLLPRRRMGGQSSVRIGAPIKQRLPALGTATAADTPSAALRQLRPLRLGHLYIEWDPQSPASILDGAANEANGLNARLALAITTQPHLPDWRAIAALLRPHAHLLDRIHVLDAKTLTTTPGTAATARRAFRQAGINIPIGGGSANSLANVNRTRDAPGDLDFVAYGLTPQTHHRDDEHILRTVQVQRDLVRHAQRVAHTTSVAVTPITWRRRDDVEADGRLQLPLAAVWLLGTLTSLRGAANATFLNTHQLSAQPEPLTRLITAIADHGQQRLRTTQTNDRALAVLAFEGTTIVGNASNQEREVTLALPNLPPWQIHLRPHDIHYATSEAHSA